MKIQIRNYAILFLIAGLVVGLDQWTKWLVRENLPFQTTWLPAGLNWLKPFARIVHWNNRGAAFGMLQEAWLLFTLLAVIVIAAILYYYPRVPAGDWTLRIALGLQLGGAMGNLIDRIMFTGRVTDFISIGTFPVFNIADSAISIGVVVLLLGVWWRDRKVERKFGRLSSMDDAAGYRPGE